MFYDFKIHGDGKNSITVSIDGREQVYTLVHFQEDRGPFVSCDIDGRNVPMPEMYRLVLDMCPQSGDLDTTPTVYGEGTWLH